MRYTAFFPFMFLIFSFHSQAQDESLVGYDSIVEELSSSTYSGDSLGGADMLSNVKLHTGLGISTSYLTIAPERGSRMNAFMRGVEFNFGIDLFSENWISEVAVRTYQPEDVNETTQISMREFDLKLTYQSQIAQSLRSRFSGGLAARYLKFRSRDADEITKRQYSTPASIMAAGLQYSINKAISIGTDLSYRTALIDETVDDSSFDASVRLDAQF